MAATKYNVRMLYSRVQTILLRQRRRKQQRSIPEISAPFNLKLEPVSLPGITEDELCILREKAAASCIGVAETMVPRSASTMSHASPRLITGLAPSATTTATFAY